MSYKALYDVYMFYNTMFRCYVVEGLSYIYMFLIRHIFWNNIFCSTTYYSKQHMFFNNTYMFLNNIYMSFNIIGHMYVMHRLTACIYLYIYRNICIYIHIYTHIYTHLYVYSCVYMYVFLVMSPTLSVFVTPNRHLFKPFVFC